MRIIVGFLITVLLTACKNTNLPEATPKTCSEVYDNVIMMSDHFTQLANSKIPKLPQDNEAAFIQIVRLFYAMDYTLTRKPDWIPDGMLNRYNITLPTGQVWMHDNFLKWSVERQIGYLIHEMNHVVVQKELGAKEFATRYISDTEFRLAVELVAYGAQLKELIRRMGEDPRWEKNWREYTKQGLYTNYFIGLSMDLDCISRIANTTWGEVTLIKANITS